MVGSQVPPQFVPGPFKKPAASRRVWSRVEETAVLNALLDLVANGWRSDNGFRAGYLLQLESAMRVKFPNGRPLTQKHINSKLTVWKKTYSTLSQVVGTSGFGFDPTTNTIDVPDDAVWDSYVKVYKEAESFRDKTFPYYEDWKICFGNDRANGKAAQQIEDAILDLEHPHDLTDEVYDIHVVSGAKGKSVPRAYSGRGSTPRDYTMPNAEDLDDTTSTHIPIGAPFNRDVDPNSNHESGKRKSREGSALAEQLVSLLGGLVEKTNQNFGEMSSRMAAQSNPPPPQAAPVEPPSKTKQVYNLVSKMGIHPIQLMIAVTHKIIDSPQNTELFLSMDEATREAYVEIIINGGPGTAGV